MDTITADKRTARTPLAQPGAVFLHCLPAKGGEEVAAAVIDGPQSVVWKSLRTGCQPRRHCC